MVILYIYSTCWRIKSVFYEHQHQLDRLLGIVDKYLVLTQPVHYKNDINALRFQDNEVGDKVYPLILRFTFRHSCRAGISPHGELTII
jgi:hypothetical protein